MTLPVDYDKFTILLEYTEGQTLRINLLLIVQFWVRHDSWVKALTKHLQIPADSEVPQIWKLSNTQSCKQVIFSLEFLNILL